MTIQAAAIFETLLVVGKILLTNSRSNIRRYFVWIGFQLNAPESPRSSPSMPSMSASSSSKSYTSALDFIRSALTDLGSGENLKAPVREYPRY